jgi:hypothetical protein
MPISLEEFDQFVTDEAGKEPVCAGAASNWACRNPHWDGTGVPPASRTDHNARDVRCDSPANLLVMIDGTHAPSWGYAASACSAHWHWALEHWKAGSQAPVGERDAAGTWRLT